MEQKLSAAAPAAASAAKDTESTESTGWVWSAVDLMVLSPVSTARVYGPSLQVTGFLYPSTRAVLTCARFF